MVIAKLSATGGGCFVRLGGFCSVPSAFCACVGERDLLSSKGICCKRYDSCRCPCKNRGGMNSRSPGKSGADSRFHHLTGNGTWNASVHHVSKNPVSEDKASTSTPQCLPPRRIYTYIYLHISVHCLSINALSIVPLVS